MGQSVEASFDTKPVRASEQLDWATLDAYIRPRLAEQLGDKFDSNAPLAVEQFPGGRSNLTYLLRFGDQEFALRRPPFGPVPPKAHDMARECRILEAIHNTFPLAPKPYILCEDLDVIGANFYVMERRHGLVIRHEETHHFANQPDQRHKASRAMIDVLADLHLVDIEASGLNALGKPIGFVKRQVTGWTGRWHGSKTSEQVEMNALSDWLLARLPPDPAKASLVHGDYKLDNVMFNPNDLSKIVAVFDWEMSAVGDPLIDLGIVLAYWTHIAPAAKDESLIIVTTRPGWYSRDELLSHYRERTGLDLSNIKFYEVFAVFKIAVVLQQIYFRYKRGQTDDARFAHLDRGVEVLARIATSLAS